MPKQYEAMRDKFLSEGLSPAAAKKKAARNYNAEHPNNPVGPHYDKSKRKSPFKRRQAR